MSIASLKKQKRNREVKRDSRILQRTKAGVPPRPRQSAHSIDNHQLYPTGERTKKTLKKISQNQSTLCIYFRLVQCISNLNVIIAILKSTYTQVISYTFTMLCCQCARTSFSDRNRSKKFKSLWANFSNLCRPFIAKLTGNDLFQVVLCISCQNLVIWTMRLNIHYGHAQHKSAEKTHFSIEIRPNSFPCKI